MKIVSSEYRTLGGISGRALRSGSLVVFAVLLLAPRCQAQAVSPEAEADQPTADVVLDGRVLLRVRGVSALPAEQRAQNIAERIAAAAGDPAISADTVQVTESEDRSAILAGDRPLFLVSLRTFRPPQGAAARGLEGGGQSFRHGDNR